MTRPVRSCSSGCFPATAPGMTHERAGQGLPGTRQRIPEPQRGQGPHPVREADCGNIAQPYGDQRVRIARLLP